MPKRVSWLVRPISLFRFRSTEYIERFLADKRLQIFEGCDLPIEELKWIDECLHELRRRKSPRVKKDWSSYDLDRRCFLYSIGEVGFLSAAHEIEEFLEQAQQLEFLNWQMLEAIYRAERELRWMRKHGCQTQHEAARMGAIQPKRNDMATRQRLAQTLAEWRTVRISPHKIAIVGSRHFPALHLVEMFVGDLPQNSIVISGGAAGVDASAAQAATARNMETMVFNADWEEHGRKAGPLRNIQIVDACDSAVAFWDGQSRGTLHTIMTALGQGKPVQVLDTEGREMDRQYVWDMIEKHFQNRKA